MKTTKIYVTEQDLRVAVSKAISIIQEAPGDTKVASLDDQALGQLQAMISDMLRNVSQEKLDDSIIQVLGGKPGVKASGEAVSAGLIKFPYTMGSKKVTSREEFVKSVRATQKDDPDKIGNYLGLLINYELNRIFPDGLKISNYEDGKATGTFTIVNPAMFLSIVALEAHPGTNLEQSAALMKPSELGSYINALTTGEKKSLSVAFMDRLRSLSTGTIEKIKELEPINVTTTTGDTQEIELKLPDLTVIGSSSRAAADAANIAARTFATNAAPLADAAEDIVSALRGGTLGVSGGYSIENPADIFQTTEDLKMLADALLDAYDTGLVIVDSAQVGESAQNELRYLKDQSAGLSTAVYAAAEISNNRSVGDAILTGFSIAGPVALVAWSQYSYKKAIRTTGKDSLLEKLGGISRWWIKRGEAKAVAAAVKGTTVKNLEDLEGLRAARQRAREDYTASVDSTWSEIVENSTSAMNRLMEENAARYEAEAIAALQAVTDRLADPNAKNDVLILVQEMDEEVDALVASKEGMQLDVDERQAAIQPIINKLKSLGLDENESLNISTNFYLSREERAAIEHDMARVDAALEKYDGSLAALFTEKLEGISKEAKALKTTVTKELAASPEFAEFASEVKWTRVKGMSVASLTSVFFGWVFARSMQALMSAGPSGAVVADCALRQSITADGKPQVTRDSTTAVAALSRDGVLAPGANNLLRKISFKTSRTLGGVQRAEINALIEAVKVVFNNAINYTTDQAQIDALRTARGNVR